ncbi:MAG: hypothetical protein ABI629_21270 [bacterium]
MRPFALLVAALVAALVPPSAVSALAGARLLRDIVAGPASSDLEFAGVVNGRLLFFATDDAHGRELWRSDGTPQGTQLVRDIRLGPLGSIDYGYGGYAVFAGRLAFSASDGEGGAQLWSSDGSEAGTFLVRDVAPGISRAMVRLLTPAGARLWFTAQTNFYDESLDETARGTEDLWVTDLTAEGTERLATVGFWQPGFSGGAFAVSSLTPLNEGVLVARKDAFECCESVSLRNVDAAGEISLLYDFDSGGHLGYLPALQPFVAAGAAYFSTRGAHGGDCALLRTDGVDIAAVDTGDRSCALSPLATFGADLLLKRDGAPLELLRATPTDPELVLVAELGEGSVGDPSVTTPAGFYFIVARPYADELWRADSTTHPPSLLRGFERDDTTPRYAGGLTRAGDGVFLWVGDSEGHNSILWKSDGTAGTTVPLGVLPPSVSGGATAESGSYVFFAGYDAEHGGELWMLDRGPECVGDCDADGAVGVAEVITAIDVALGLANLGACPAADATADLRVSIDEIVSSVHSALYGCAASQRHWPTASPQL